MAPGSRRGDLELACPAHVERQRAALAEHLELQGVGVAERDARDAQVAGRAVREAHGEAGPVVVLDRLALVADLDVGVPDDGAERHRPLADHGGQRRAGHRLDRAEQELGGVGEVAAQVRERARAGLAAVAPAHRRLRVAAVVGPVLRADVQRAAQLAGPSCSRAAAIPGVRRNVNPTRATTPAASTASIIACGIGGGRGERLLAQDVLARRGQLLDDLAVQVVGHHHAHRRRCRRP